MTITNIIYCNMTITNTNILQYELYYYDKVQYIAKLLQYFAIKLDPPMRG